MVNLVETLMVNKLTCVKVKNARVTFTHTVKYK